MKVDPSSGNPAKVTGRVQTDSAGAPHESANRKAEGKVKVHPQPAGIKEQQQ